MTEEVQKEEKPNPYNAKKSWHKKDDKPYVSSESLFFEEPKNKLYDNDDITQAENVNTEELESKKEEVQQDKPYKRPNYKKRYDDLKKHYDSKLNEFKSREKELLKQAEPTYVAPKSQEDLEKFKQEHPDIYEVVETVAHLQSDSKAKVLEEQLTELQQRELQIRKADAEKRLMEKHPDFSDIRNSEDFHSWAKEQHPSIQSWIYDNTDDADLASRALDLFKKDMDLVTPKKTTKSKSQSKANAADMVSTKTTTVDTQQEKIWTEQEIASMSVDEFDKFEKEISDAMQDGRIAR